MEKAKWVLRLDKVATDPDLKKIMRRMADQLKQDGDKSRDRLLKSLGL